MASQEQSESGRPPAADGPNEPYLLYRLLKLSNLIGRPFFANFSERYDLTMNDLRVLMTLAPMGEAASHELCQVTGMHPMNVSRSVARLTRQGRVEVRSDPANRRRKILTLTDAGRSLCRKLAPHVKVISDFLFEPLEAEEARILAALVETLTRRLEPVDPSSPLLIDAEALEREAPSDSEPPRDHLGGARVPASRRNSSPLR